MDPDMKRETNMKNVETASGEKRLLTFATLFVLVATLATACASRPPSLEDRVHHKQMEEKIMRRAR
jgi:hypothetical protein